MAVAPTHVAVLPVEKPTPTVYALIPAHNEDGVLAQSLAALQSQTRPPDRIVVVADNCTDTTAEVARQHSVEVFETRRNSCKKAGALNQALHVALPELADGDAVLVMDADSFLEPQFLERALSYLAQDRVGGVGGVFTGRGGGGFVGMLQRNEYARYARDVARLRGRVLVLTGTATVFSVAALRDVVEARRAGLLPGGRDVYDTSVLTEDCELTLALLHRGYRVLSPSECALTTEVMESWRALFRQRLRWRRGALENVLEYGVTRVTWRYWGRQFLLAAGVFVTTVYLGSIVFSLLANGTIQLHPVWIGVTAIFVLERAVTVRSRGPFMMAIGAVLFVEMMFDLVLQAVYVRAVWETITRAERRW